MSQHQATIRWSRSAPEPDFLKGKYSREHTWTFDGGATVLASPAPSVVPKPWSNPAYVDPEEAFIASLASCHMLTFLWLATKEGFVVDSYEDEATAEMAKNERGVPWVARLTLHPRIVWTGEKRPSPSDLDRLHHKAHEQCFIANSVKTEIVVAGIA